MSKGTTRRTVRIDDGLWEKAQSKAKEQGRDVSAVIRELLTEWTKGDNS